MRSMPRHLAALSTLAVAACAATPAAPPLESVLLPPPIARVGEPLARSALPCSIEGDGDPGGYAPYGVFGGRSGDELIAWVREPSRVPLRFVELPPIAGDAARRARVSLAKRGLRADGWVSIEERSFQLRERIDAMSGHLWALPGSVVRALGTRDDGNVVVRAETPFASPQHVELVAPCKALAFTAQRLPETKTARVSVPGRPAVVKGTRLDFFASPGSDPRFSVSMVDGALVELLDSSRAFKRIRVGHDPSDGRFEGTVMAQGWVPEDQIAAAPSSTDRDSHCGIPDENDRCPELVALVDTQVHLGSPDGPAIGVLERGTFVRTRDKRGAFISIDLDASPLGPPPKQSWWVDALDVGDECTANDLAGSFRDDGCPFKP